VREREMSEEKEERKEGEGRKAGRVGGTVHTQKLYARVMKQVLNADAVTLSANKIFPGTPQSIIGPPVPASQQGRKWHLPVSVPNT
jgi:hypothetical protein